MSFCKKMIALNSVTVSYIILFDLVMSFSSNQVDNSMAVKCDLERQIRSADFKFLQLRTEMQMERHRSAALAEENSDANKKV